MLKASGSVSLRITRSIRVCFLVALYVLLFAAAPSLAAPGAEENEVVFPIAPIPASQLVPLAEALETRGDLSLQDASMEKALFTIGSTWRVNIMIGKDVAGTVSCVYRNAPLREILDAILLANGYSYRAVGDTLVVQKAQEVGSANPLFESAAIPIIHSDLTEVVEGAQLLLSNQGQIRALESARTILVVDFADRVAKIRSFVSQMDAAASKSSGGIPAESYKRLQVAYFKMHFIPVDNAKEPLDAVLSNVGRVSTMPAENRLVVVDYASNLEMVRKVLDKIDRPRPQVRITALIYDISLQDVEQLGLNWSSAGKGNTIGEDGTADQVLALDTQTLAPFPSGTAGGTLTIKSLTKNFDINTIGLFLQNANDARLLADPHLTVEDNETANMSSVQQIPFQQITQSELGGQIGTTTFKDVGIKLQVTPNIASDGSVKMFIEQEFSRVAGFTENDNQPIIDSRTANTSVRVANRQTLVIGGLRQRSDTGDFNGIPFLKDIRFIGPIFRSRNTTVRESELIVFIQPEIIGYDHLSPPREFMAQETVDCRLDRIPVAEGCGGPGGNQCGNVLGSSCSDELIQLPAVGGETYHVPQAVDQQADESSPLQGQIPFRQGFEDRYRATGATDGNRRRLVDSAPQSTEPNTARSNAMKRILGL